MIIDRDTINKKIASEYDRSNADSIIKKMLKDNNFKELFITKLISLDGTNPSVMTNRF